MGLFDNIANAAKKAQEKMAEAVAAQQRNAAGGILGNLVGVPGAATDGPPAPPAVNYDAAEWLFNTDAGQQGPATAKQLIALVAARMLTPQSPVWRKGMTDWVPIASVNDLAPLLAEVAPPPPGQLPASFPVSERVTADMSIPAISGYGTPDIRLVVDDAVIGWSPIDKGMAGIEFASGKGEHTVLLQKMYSDGERVEKHKEYKVSFSLPGHYSISGAKGGFFAEFPKALAWTYSPFPRDCIQAPPSRKKLLVGLWEETGDTGMSLTFTSEGAVMRSDGVAGQYEWPDRDTIRCTFGAGDTREYTVLSIGRVEMIVKHGSSSHHFQKGVTATEAEAARLAEIRKKERAEASARNAQNAAAFMQTAAGLAAIAGTGAAIASMASSNGDAGSSDSSTGSGLKRITCPQCGGTGFGGGVAIAAQRARAGDTPNVGGFGSCERCRGTGTTYG